MTKLSIEQIKAQYKLSDVIGKRIKLTKEGREYKACCPFHHEDTPSFTIVDERNFYYCFGCGAKGDVINFIQDYDGAATIQEAIDILTGDQAPPSRAPEKIEKEPIKGKYDDWEPIEIDEDAPPIEANKKIVHYNTRRDKVSTVTPVMVWKYSGTNGYVIRYEFTRNDNGKRVKATPTLRWCRNLVTGKKMWVTYPFDRPRDLYNYPELEERPDAPILIVEGEKAAQAGIDELREHYVVITWAGGTKALKHSDWSKIKGRAVTIWPDNDPQGMGAVFDIADILINDNGPIHIVNFDLDKPDGWDLWDAVHIDNMSAADILAYIEDKKKLYERKKKPDRIREAIEHEENQHGRFDEALKAMPFKILGHNNGMYYYFPKSGRQIVPLTAGAHTALNLFQLASERDWKLGFLEDWSKPDDRQIYRSAAAAMMQKAQEKGVFNPDKIIRGRGAWMDEERIILHCGEHCYVDGKKTDPFEVESKYIYEANSNLIAPAGKELEAAEGKELHDLIKMLSWENPLSASLLAGWIAIAPVCAVLPWRPHIYIMGSTGSGKSTITEQILKPLLEFIAIMVHGGTTEAALRRKLRNDARPVIIDEAEPENKSKIAMQDVLGLARIASSGGDINKVDMSGRGGVEVFTVRSCFCFLSINNTIKELADETRFSKLALQVNMSENAQAHFEQIEMKIHDLITPDYAKRLFTRTVNNMPTLLKNIKTIRKAAIEVLRNGRAADQIAPMIAGLYLLSNDGEISLEAAKKWIQAHDWGQHTAIYEAKDHERLLERILTSKIRVYTQGGATMDMPIGSAIKYAAGIKSENPDHSSVISPIGCEVALKETGIKLNRADKLVYFANSCTPLRNILSGSAWENDWKSVLKNFKGAVRSDKNMHFGGGIKSRGTALPYEYFTEEEIMPAASIIEAA